MDTIVSNTAYVVLVCIMMGTLRACASDPVRESPGESIADAAVTYRVKAALLSDPLTQSAGIYVRTYKDLVQLSGFAVEDEQRVRAAQLALKVPGVNAVHNDILLKEQQAEIVSKRSHWYLGSDNGMGSFSRMEWE
jgi:hypothetical protein